MLPKSTSFSSYQSLITSSCKHRIPGSYKEHLTVDAEIADNRPPAF